MRRGGRVVTAVQRAPAGAVIEAHARQLGATLRLARPLGRASGSPNLVRAPTGSGGIVAPLALAGAHQRQNAAVAVAAADELTSAGLALTPAAVRNGLERVRWPGRCEFITGSPGVMIDAAHNPDSARALARTLRELRLPRPRWLVVGLYRDKDLAGFTRALAPEIDGVIATRARGVRAAEPSLVASAFEAAGVSAVSVADSAIQALDDARLAANPGGTVVVAGSFTVAAAAREWAGLVSADDVDPPL